MGCSVAARYGSWFAHTCKKQDATYFRAAACTRAFAFTEYYVSAPAVPGGKREGCYTGSTEAAFEKPTSSRSRIVFFGRKSDQGVTVQETVLSLVLKA